MEDLDPNQYEKNIAFWQLFHFVFSTINTGALVLLCYFSFSPHSPLAKKNPQPDTFNNIAYPTYIGLLTIPCFLALYFISPYWGMFSDDPETKISEEEITTQTDQIKQCIMEHSIAFGIPVNPTIFIIKNNVFNAMVFQLNACTPQKLTVNSACVRYDNRNHGSLKILLAHELMHFEYDFPYFSLKRFRHFAYVFNLILSCFIYTPLQTSYSIANGALMDLQPEWIYLPLVGLFLSFINLVGYFHETCTQERNAYFCAIFGKIKFEPNELDKHITHYNSLLSEDSFFNSLFRTHPHKFERIALLRAAKMPPPDTAMEIC